MSHSTTTTLKNQRFCTSHFFHFQTFETQLFDQLVGWFSILFKNDSVEYPQKCLAKFMVLNNNISIKPFVMVYFSVSYLCWGLGFHSLTALKYKFSFPRLKLNLLPGLQCVRALKLSRSQFPGFGGFRGSTSAGVGHPTCIQTCSWRGVVDLTESKQLLN